MVGNILYYIEGIGQFVRDQLTAQIPAVKMPAFGRSCGDSDFRAVGIGAISGNGAVTKTAYDDVIFVEFENSNEMHVLARAELIYPVVRYEFAIHGPADEVVTRGRSGNKRNRGTMGVRACAGCGTAVCSGDDGVSVNLEAGDVDCIRIRGEGVLKLGAERFGGAKLKPTDEVIAFARGSDQRGGSSMGIQTAANSGAFTFCLKIDLIFADLKDCSKSDVFNRCSSKSRKSVDQGSTIIPTDETIAFAGRCNELEVFIVLIRTGACNGTCADHVNGNVVNIFREHGGKGSLAVNDDLNTCVVAEENAVLLPFDKIAAFICVGIKRHLIVIRVQSI